MGWTLQRHGGKHDVWISADGSFTEFVPRHPEINERLCPGHPETGEGEAMRFPGRVKKAGRFWLVEIPALDALTQGRTKREAFAMAEDLIETMADARGFRATVYSTGAETFEIGANRIGVLLALLLRRRLLRNWDNARRTPMHDMSRERRCRPSRNWNSFSKRLLPTRRLCGTSPCEPESLASHFGFEMRCEWGARIII
jgi:hypothetical protein